MRRLKESKYIYKRKNYNWKKTDLVCMSDKLNEKTVSLL